MFWSIVETLIRWDEWITYRESTISECISAATTRHSPALPTLYIVTWEAQLYPQLSYPTRHYLILPYSTVHCHCPYIIWIKYLSTVPIPPFLPISRDPPASNNTVAPICSTIYSHPPPPSYRTHQSGSFRAAGPGTPSAGRSTTRLILREYLIILCNYLNIKKPKNKFWHICHRSTPRSST